VLNRRTEVQAVLGEGEADFQNDAASAMDVFLSRRKVLDKISTKKKPLSIISIYLQFSHNFFPSTVLRPSEPQLARCLKVSIIIFSTGGALCKGAAPLVEQKEVDGGPGLVTTRLN
jgi:hypothetical protein